MRYLTVRDVPARLAKALKRERSRSGRSLNQTLIRLLSIAVGLEPDTKRSNGLARLAGSWTADQHREFESAIRDLKKIDEELWR